MIFAIGEILADVVMDGDGNMNAYLGGAPFNAAVAAGRAGADVSFLGRVGDDPLGKFLEKEAKKYPVKSLLQVDPVRPTTIAFVSVDDKGERDFKFLRHDAADAFIEYSERFFPKNPSFLHLGSLFLSEKHGKELAVFAQKYCKETGAKLSFDVNFRSDIFPDVEEAKEAYLPLVYAADVVKFSEEETEILFDKPYERALREDVKNPLAVVTLGKKGCAVKYGKDIFLVPTLPVVPVDTTGAGDAFYGTLLAGIDRVGYDKLTRESLKKIVNEANEAGSQATQRKGAL